MTVIHVTLLLPIGSSFLLGHVGTSSSSFLNNRLWFLRVSKCTAMHVMPAHLFLIQEAGHILWNFEIIKSHYFSLHAGTVSLFICLQNIVCENNRTYLPYLPSLHFLKDLWDKSNVMWFLRGQTSDKRCQYKKHSRVCLF